MTSKKFWTEKNIIIISSIFGFFLFVLVVVAGLTTRAEQKTEVITEPILCEYKTEDDPNLEKGKTEIRQECVEGEKTFTYEVSYINDVEQSRQLTGEETTREMIPEIKAIGTKEEEPEPVSAPTSDSGSAQAPTSNSGSRSNSSSSSSSSSSDNTYKRDGNYTGYCKDGTPATGNPHARGRANSCYGHGGWVGN